MKNQREVKRLNQKFDGDLEFGDGLKPNEGLKPSKDLELGKGLEKYLSQVDRYLKYLPVSEKIDILSGLKNSFVARLASGQCEEEILAEMKPAKAFARDYLGESIARNREFSFSHFMKLLGFYSLASLAFVSIIPTLAILSVSFIFASGFSVLGGVFGFIKGVFPNSLFENIKFMFFTHEISGISALLAGLFIAVVFAVLAALCWKATEIIFQYLQRTSRKLKRHDVQN